MHARALDFCFWQQCRLSDTSVNIIRRATTSPLHHLITMANESITINHHAVRARQLDRATCVIARPSSVCTVTSQSMSHHVATHADVSALRVLDSYSRVARRVALLFVLSLNVFAPN